MWGSILDPGSMTWAEGRRLTYWATQAPLNIISFKKYTNQNHKIDGTHQVYYMKLNKSVREK